MVRSRLNFGPEPRRSSANLRKNLLSFAVPVLVNPVDSLDDLLGRKQIAHSSAFESDQSRLCAARRAQPNRLM